MNNSTNTLARANYTYDGTGRLEYLFGTNAEQFKFDGEGSITNDFQ